MPNNSPIRGHDMKISVIIPVYNTQDYLADCVDSVLNQTLDEIEIILINDGSTDNSGKIIGEYVKKHPDRIRELSVVNGGQGRARNFGIDMARGEYLSFIDSDDYLENNALELMYSAAVEDDADIVVCDMEKRYDDGRREYVKAALQSDPLASAGSSSNKIFRRSTVGTVRFPVGLWYEDFAFSAKLLLKSSRTVFVEKPLYIYRCGQSSTMNNNNARKNLDIIKIMEDIHDFASSEGKHDGFEFMLINHVLLDSIKRLQLQNSSEKKAVISQLRKYVKTYIPRLSACESYKRESRNRRLIMALNYHGLEGLAVLLLKLKKSK